MFLSDNDFTKIDEKQNLNNAMFYLHPCLMTKKSEDAGREIYEDRLYILIVSPGQTKTEVRRPARPEDKQAYARAWEAYEKGHGQAVTGTPIEQLPQLPPSRAKELKACNIRTCEQLAALSDINMTNVGMDASLLRNRARAFIAKTSQVEHELKARIQELEGIVHNLTKQVGTLQPASTIAPLAQPVMAAATEEMETV